MQAVDNTLVKDQTVEEMDINMESVVLVGMTLIEPEQGDTMQWSPRRMAGNKTTMTKMLEVNTLVHSHEVTEGEVGAEASNTQEGNEDLEREKETYKESNIGKEENKDDGEYEGESCSEEGEE